MFPSGACLCSDVCGSCVVRRTLGGWEILTSPFGPWAFASSQMYIEADGAGLVFAGPLLRGPGLLWLQGWARVPWGSCPASPGLWAAAAVANACPGGSWSQDPPPRSREQAPAGRGKGCESPSTELPRRGWGVLRRGRGAWLQAGPRWAAEGQRAPHPWRQVEIQTPSPVWAPGALPSPPHEAGRACLRGVRVGQVPRTERRGVNHFPAWPPAALPPPKLPGSPWHLSLDHQGWRGPH